MQITLRKSVGRSSYLLDDVILPTVWTLLQGVWMFMLTRLCPLLLTLIILCLKPNREPLRSCAVFLAARDHSIPCKAFVVYVRPIWEYCSPFWSSCCASSTNKLESVQRCFTKRLTSLHSLSYVERLTVGAILGFEQLELRRIYPDLTMCIRSC